MEKEIYQIQSLLNQVDGIVKKYDHIAEISGERFNIFSILDLQDSETRLHSKLINELLNPSGKHGQKDLFLKLFINVINSKISDKTTADNSKNISSQKITEFKTASAKSEIEKHTGFKNEDSTEGGRIDILVNDYNKHGIIIENKIWAGDQENQLLRYHNYGEKAFDLFHLIYLTIDGKEPSEWSTNKALNENHFFCISYKEDILRWLELCRKECTQLPIIRETITQYINQLKNYSGQSNNHMKTQDIIKEISNSNANIKSSFEIAQSLSIFKNNMFEKFLIDLINSNQEYNLIVDEHDETIGTMKTYKYSGISFKKANWIEYQIRFEFGSNWFNDLYFGIRKKNETISENSDNFIKLKTSINKASSGWWPYYEYFESENRYWWENAQVWIDINDGIMHNLFKEKIKIILDIIEEKKLDHLM